MSTDYTLAYGTHSTPAEGRCAMEWVSYLAGEPHSDDPACVSPVLRAFCTTLNDTLDDMPRQRLRPYLTRTIGTAGDGLDEARSWMAMDWLVRTYTPVWLAAANLNDAAERTAALAPVQDGPALRVALDTLELERREARGAWTAARAAAWAAPWIAGRAAAREAAWGSGGATVWAAARVAVGDIAGDRARAAAREIAGDAAATIARGARTGGNRAAGREAARTALAPTLEDLRASTFALLDRMLPTVALATPVVEDADRICSRAPLAV